MSELQFIVDKCVEASHLFSLIISLGNTEVLLKPVPWSLPFYIQFLFPRNIISSDGLLGQEISARICKANKALGCLHTCVLNQHNISSQPSSKYTRPFIWMWYMDTLQETPESAGTLPPVQPQINLKNQMTGQSHEPGSPQHSGNHTYTGHDPQSTALLDRIITWVVGC